MDRKKKKRNRSSDSRYIDPRYAFVKKHFKLAYLSDIGLLEFSFPFKKHIKYTPDVFNYGFCYLESQDLVVSAIVMSPETNKYISKHLPKLKKFCYVRKGRMDKLWTATCYVSDIMKFGSVILVSDATIESCKGMKRFKLDS